MVTELIGLITSVVSRVFPDKTEAQKLQFAKELQAAMLEAQSASDQVEVNKVEAANEKVFVAGWRPFVGWVCGLAFAWVYLLQPMLIFLLVAAGQPAPALPQIGIEQMVPVLLGMLGLGGLRTYEKVKK